MKIPTLRLFGVKTSKNIIVINDMQYLNQTGDISIVIPKNKNIPMMRHMTIFNHWDLILSVK